MTTAANGDASGAIDPQIASVAAEWFSRVSSGHFGEADRRAWMAWRRSDPAHEQAWQQVEAVSRRFDLLLPGAGMAALDRRRPDGRRRALRVMAGLGVGAGAGWLAWQQSAWHDWMADHRTGTGERREVVLADGTRLMLNTRTAVDAQFGTDIRRVDLLSGEVQISTAADPRQRPFVLMTRFGELRPIGTRFIVRRHESFVRLTVLEGEVQARAFGAETADGRATASIERRIRAGESVRLSGTGISASEAADGGADAWTRGLLVADGMRLGDFAAELARYRSGVITCDLAVADLRLSGAFPLDDTDRALAAAAQALPLRIQPMTRLWIWIRIRPN